MSKQENKKSRISKNTLKTAKRLLKYVTETYKVRFILVFICILISSVATISVSLSLKFLLDDFIIPLIGQQNPDFAGLYSALSVLGCIFLLGVISTFIYTRMMVYIGQGVLKRVRDDMFEHMQTLPIRYFDQRTNGSIMSLYTNDTDTLRQMISQSIPQALMSFFTIIVTFISMLVLSPLLTVLAVVVILISVGVSGYYYATVRDNLASRAATTSDTFRKYFTDTYDQFYTQAEATVTTFQDQDKFEQQFLDANGRILLSTSGLSGGGVASTEDASQALSGQKTAVFTGRDPLSGERVMSVTAPLLSARGDLVGGVRYITSLRIVERQIWIIVGCSLLACLLFLMLVVASNSYFIRSIVDPVLKINTIAKEIAAGRYGVRLQKTYDDEIGELCDTINYMSDEISRAERMKNDFISSVSHELRTPLTAIGGWSETLLAGGGEDPEEVMQGLTIIQKEAGRLTRMVEELLDFARIESGRMKLEIETFDMSIELYEAVYMYENLLKKSGIRLLYDEDVDANYYINGDRHRMKQVFLNILDNAAKYGGDGKQIDIDLKRDGGNIVVSVRDYGQGIPEAELPFVKEKFYKGSSKQRGSGIGLAVTEEIVSMHGGTLDIASEVGKGTTVTVTMPSAKSEEALGITGAIPKASETPFTEGEHS